MRVLGASLVLLLSVSAQAASRSAARERLAAGDARGAVAAYAELPAMTAADAGEFAYALAQAGQAGGALDLLDRGHLLDKSDPAFLYHQAAILEWLGMADVARELPGKAPRWLRAAAPLPPAGAEPIGAFREEVLEAERLRKARKTVTAAHRLHGITRQYPEEPIGWSAYGLVLQEMGAVRAAAEAVARQLSAGEGVEEQAHRMLELHREELLKSPPLSASRPRKLNEYLKGRYLAFMGGNMSKTETDTTYSANLRLGKFLTDRFDVALNAGYVSGYDDSELNGLSGGLSGRFSQPLPIVAPVNATAGLRVQSTPGPDGEVSVVLTPGLSYFLEGGSIDLYLDIPTSGPAKDSRTLSLGYTAYFGGPR